MTAERLREIIQGIEVTERDHDGRNKIAGWTEELRELADRIDARERDGLWWM